MDKQRAREYATRLSDDDRRATESGRYCFDIGKTPTPRKVKPAPEHPFRPVRIYTQDGLIIRCSPPRSRCYDACQDDTHRVRAALMSR